MFGVKSLEHHYYKNSTMIMDSPSIINLDRSHITTVLCWHTNIELAVDCRRPNSEIVVPNHQQRTWQSMNTSKIEKRKENDEYRYRSINK